MTKEGFPEEVLPKNGSLEREEETQHLSDSPGLELPGPRGGKGCCGESSMGESLRELELYLAEQTVESFYRI